VQLRFSNKIPGDQKMKQASLLLSLTLICISNLAFAQSSLRMLVDPNYAVLEKFPEYRSCGNANIIACYLIQFGDCANDNPRVAIPACTRALAVQDNRRFAVNVRFERAVRYMLRANAYTLQGNLDRALTDYDRAVRADSGVFWIQMPRGDAYFLSGIYDEALESYNRVIELEPDEVAALSSRSLVLAAAPDEDLRDPAQALVDAQRANEIEPGQPAYIDALAVANAANGYFDLAVAEEQRAIDLLLPDDQSTRDGYRERLDLFRAGMVFQMTARSES
jgi:tetratricopeptide (TPR) repeat protein